MSIHLTYDERAIRSTSGLIVNDTTIQCELFDGITGLRIMEEQTLDIVGGELEIDMRIPNGAYKICVKRNEEPYEEGMLEFTVARTPVSLALTGEPPMANIILIQNAEELEKSWYINRSIVPLLLGAGAFDFFKSTLPMAMSSKDLIEQLKLIVAEISPVLAEAMNASAIEQMIDYANKILDVPSIMLPANLPNARDVLGPTTTTAVRSNLGVDDTEVTVTFDESAVSGFDEYEIYVDYTFMARGDNAPVGGTITHVMNYPDDGNPHLVNVLYWGNDIPDEPNALSRFGPNATLMPAP